MKSLPWPVPFPFFLPVHWGYDLRSKLKKHLTVCLWNSHFSNFTLIWFSKDLVKTRHTVHAWHLQLKLKKMKHGEFCMSSIYWPAHKHDQIFMEAWCSNINNFPFLMILYALNKSNLVHIFTPCTKGNGFQYFTVMTFKSLYSIQCFNPILFSHEKRSLYWLGSMHEHAWS